MYTDKVQNVRVALMEMKSPRFLINWINQTLETDIKELSNLSTGVIYCQLMGSIFPESIDLSEVRYSSRTSRNQGDFGSNYKLLLKSFIHVDMNKSIPERKLLQGSGHYDFANWFYKFYQVHKTNAIFVQKEIKSKRCQTYLDITQKNNIPRDFSCPNMSQRTEDMITISDEEQDGHTFSVDSSDSDEENTFDLDRNITYDIPDDLNRKRTYDIPDDINRKRTYVVLHDSDEENRSDSDGENSIDDSDEGKTFDVPDSDRKFTYDDSDGENPSESSDCLDDLDEEKYSQNSDEDNYFGYPDDSDEENAFDVDRKSDSDEEKPCKSLDKPEENVDIPINSDDEKSFDDPVESDTKNVHVSEDLESKNTLDSDGENRCNKSDDSDKEKNVDITIKSDEEKSFDNPVKSNTENINVSGKLDLKSALDSDGDKPEQKSSDKNKTCKLHEKKTRDSEVKKTDADNELSPSYFSDLSVCCDKCNILKLMSNLDLLNQIAKMLSKMKIVHDTIMNGTENPSAALEQCTTILVNGDTIKMWENRYEKIFKTTIVNLESYIKIGDHLSETNNADSDLDAVRVLFNRLFSV